MPDVCVVIPCFNHGRFVREAVASCLAQESADVGVLIVDDGSADGSTPAACDACAGDRVLVVHQENRGLPAARNRGAAEAARAWAPGYLVFLDADDYLRPAFVQRLRGAIEAGGEAVSHGYCQEELVELGTGIWRVPEWDPLLLLITNLHPVTALIRRDRFEAVGGFDESMRDGYEDWEFWIRISARGWRGARVREPLFVWRRHSHETMVMEAVKRHDELYRRIMARHRDLYRVRGEELLALTNSLLRKFDANWIDETGFPIPLQYLRGCHDEVVRLRGELAARGSDTGALAARLREAESKLEQQRAWYESFAAVRLHRAVHRLVDRLPRPLAAGGRGVLAALRRLISGPAKSPPGPGASH